MYVCNRIENDSVEEPEELAGEAPEQQLVGGGKCPLTYLCPIHSLIGLDYYCLALCYCLTLIDEHDEIIYDTLFSPLL
jgi:hypothetical protein